MHAFAFARFGLIFPLNAPPQPRHVEDSTPSPRRHSNLRKRRCLKDDLHGKAGAREKVWANEQDKAALLKLKARLADENRHMDEEKEKQRLELILNRVR